METELQHTFPGCYSVMQDVKRRQRRGELALAGAERAVEQLVEDAPERRRALERLDAAWEDLLFCQFHDVLAGTSIPSSLEAVRDLQGRAAVGAEELLVEASRRWAARHVPPEPFAQLVVVNADETAWTGLVEAEPSLDFDAVGRALAERSGRTARCPASSSSPRPRRSPPASCSRSSSRRARSRGCSCATTRRRPCRRRRAALEVSPHALRNERLRGRARRGRRPRAAPGRAGAARGGRDRPAPAPRRVGHLDARPRPLPRAGRGARWSGASWEVEEAGPLRARVRLEAGLGASRVRWTLTLEAGATRLGLALDVLWAERLMLLQMPIALPARPGELDERAGRGSR